MASSGPFSAFVLGATGEVGKELVKELAKHSQFSKVVLIGRRQVELPAAADNNSSEPNCPNYAKFTQQIVDFDNINNHADAFKCDIGFCALGTTRGKAGKDGFYKVDHDYVVNSAKVAKEAGCKHFNIVSSSGANQNSMIFYSKVKGQADDEVSNMGFDRVTIARPGLLLCDRAEQRTGEKIMRTVFNGLDRWRTASVETHAVAHALVANCLKPAASAVEILDNAALNKLGKE